tara:strand:- start:458 stop:3430 length:2973 start_codon:yes stop_codon:yes gene_type:complete
MSRYFSAASVVALIALLLVPSVSAQEIGGTVTDETGGVLPGVTVEVRSPALIEQVRTAVTDGAGQHLITGLVSGEYTVTFSLPGFSTVLREGIVLSAGFRANVDAQLAVGSMEETITVSGEAPVVDVANVQQNAAIDRDIIDAIPSGKSFQNLGILIPGMVGDGVVGSTLAVDVGGQGGVNYQRLAIHGGDSTDQSVQIDGMGVEAATRDGDSSNLFFADGNYSEYSIDYSGNSAEIETGGVRVSMIPREGTNDWAFQFFASGTAQSMQANNVSDELVGLGVAKDDANRLSKLWFLNPAGGGPIVKDRLWFWASHTSQRTDQFVANVYHDLVPGDLAYTPDLSRQAIDDQLARSTTLRLTAQASARNKFTFFYDRNHNKRNRFLIGNTLGYASLNIMPEAAVDSTIDVQVYQGTWTAPITNRLLLEAGVSFHPQHQNWQNTPDADPSLAGALLIPGGVAVRGMSAWFSGSTFQDRLADTNAARASLSYVTGSHAFKVGMNLTNVAENETTTSQQYLRTIQLTYTPINLADFYSTPALIENNVPANLGLYAQDQWTVDRLTMNLGVRFDYFRAGYPDHETGTSRFRPVSASFTGQQVVGFKDVQPRLGFAYDIFGDGRTALKASWGRYADRDSNTRSANINPADQNAVQNRVYIDFNGNGDPDCDPLNPAPNGECLTPSDNLAFGLPVINTFYDPDWAYGWGTRNSNYETTLSIQHQLVENVSVSVGYYNRRFVNYEAKVNRAVGLDDFGSYSVTVPSDDRLPGGGGQELTGFYDINPGLEGLYDWETTSANNYGGRGRGYNGFDFNIDARLDNLLLQGGIATGNTSWDNCALTSSLPEMQYEDGVDELVTPAFCNWDEGYQTQVKLLGSYTFPYDVVFAGTLQSYPGSMRRGVVTFNEVNGLGRPLAGGAVDINVIEPGSSYEERVNQVDIRLSKIFNMADNRIQVMFDVFNLLNENSITKSDPLFGPNYNRPQAIMPGRLAKFAIQYNF